MRESYFAVFVTQRRNFRKINGVAQCWSHGESMNHPPRGMIFFYSKAYSWIGKVGNLCKIFYSEGDTKSCWVVIQTIEWFFCWKAYITKQWTNVVGILKRFDVRHHKLRQWPSMNGETTKRFNDEKPVTSSPPCLIPNSFRISASRQ